VPGSLLEGLRVLDLGIWRPVPYATQLLAEMGAEVLKIEPPGGDPMRVFPQLFDVLNAGKRSMVVDLKTDDGREAVLALAAGADAVLEGFRPGVAERLGVGYGAVSAVNPSVVYCSISGYGEEGPLATVPGHDINYQAYAGTLDPKGVRPVPATVPIGDLGAGMTAAMATIAACFRARATGEGERIDVGIADVLATWTGAVGELTPAGSGRAMDGLPAYGIYRTADGRYVTLGVLAEAHFWQALCAALDLGELRDVEMAERVARRAELDNVVRDAVSKLALADVLELMERHDVPVAPVLDRRGMLEHPHFRARGTVVMDPRPGHVGEPAMGHPARFRLHPARGLAPAPTFDEARTVTWAPR
jgi:crotonobetainyl-CoA:carnitine CoA-transferase CaiB-like acyl-CoA transferase